jgi:hypothetical protein
MARSSSKKRPRERQDAFEIESPDRKNRLISDTAVAYREPPPSKFLIFVGCFHANLEFYTTSAPIHESTKHDEPGIEIFGDAAVSGRPLFFPLTDHP